MRCAVRALQVFPAGNVQIMGNGECALQIMSSSLCHAMAKPTIDLLGVLHSIAIGVLHSIASFAHVQEGMAKESSSSSSSV